MLIFELVVRLYFYQDRRQYLPDVDDVFVGRLVVRCYKALCSLCGCHSEVLWSEHHHCVLV